MKILLLSDTYSEHTEKWALGLAEKGIQVGLFSFNKASYEWYNHQNVTVFFEPEEKINAESTLTKLSYLKYVNVLKKIIRHFKPDILHAHYATSYGLVGALSGFHPLIISVWGSDVYDFPARSRVHKRLFQFNLRKADLLMSTSHVMKTELQKYTRKKILVTPFGVDVQVFSPRRIEKKQKEKIYVGTIKPIEEKYGISTIIDTAARLQKERPGKYHFMLIGPGNDLEQYRTQIRKAGLSEHFEVTGRIPFSEISDYHNLLDIFLNVSIDDSESFGVAAVEAMACAKPVIVTDVGGLKEVVADGMYGLVVPRKNEAALAEAIKRITDDPSFARELGKAAREHATTNYNWEHNLDLMITYYENLLTTGV